MWLPKLTRKQGEARELLKHISPATQHCVWIHFSGSSSRNLYGSFQSVSEMRWCVSIWMSHRPCIGYTGLINNAFSMCRELLRHEYEEIFYILGAAKCFKIRRDSSGNIWGQRSCQLKLQLRFRTEVLLPFKGLEFLLGHSMYLTLCLCMTNLFWLTVHHDDCFGFCEPNSRVTDSHLLARGLVCSLKFQVHSVELTRVKDAWFFKLLHFLLPSVWRFSVMYGTK